MSKLLLCSVRDDVSEQYGNITMFLTPGQAEMKFRDGVNDPERGGDMFRHPEHFHLFHLGWFDSSSGVIEVLDAPRHLVSGANVKEVSDA